MLELHIPSREYYDESKNEFTTTKSQTLLLEHSLISISKWESKCHKPFLSKDNKTSEEDLYYIKCMMITQNVSDETCRIVHETLMDEINSYVENKMTATTIRNNNEDKSHNRSIITSELIYYWMLVHNIPFECEKWHLNRLLMLINVCTAKAEKPKKLSKQELIKRNTELNAARKKQMGTSG